MKKIFLFLIGIACISAIVLFWYKQALRPVGEDGSARTPFVIQEGSSVDAISSLLEEKSLIRSALAFKIYVRLNGMESKLQAGNFIVQGSPPVSELVETLQSGKTDEISVTIPEGFTVSDIDALLVRRGLTQTGAVLDCLRTCDFSAFDFLPNRTGLADRGGRIEGYLYPDTYFVAVENFSVESFLHRLLRTFEARVLVELREDIAASGRSAHDIITMASLIEEEAISNDERPIIAGILWNRFDAQQGLGVDATVRYIINKPTAAITVQDLQVESPYNTRKYRGLPPGPIANVGLPSIRAALNPSDTEYWYYLHDSSGQIHYGRTNDEHNANKRRYLQ